MAAVLKVAAKVGGKLMKGMGKAFKAVGKVKTKQWKGMQGAMQSMGGVDFGQFLDFFTQLSAVQFVLKPLTALLNIWVQSIMIPLLPVLRPLVTEMLKLLTLSREWGLILGQLMIPGMKFLVWVGLGLVETWREVAEIAIAVGHGLLWVQSNWETLLGVISGTTLRLQAFTAVLETIRDVVSNFPGIGGGGGGGIGGIPGIGGLPGFFGGFPGIGGGGGGGGGFSLPSIPGFQHGGTLRANRPGGSLFIGGENEDETVLPGGLLEELIAETRQARIDAQFRAAFERRRR